MANIIYDKFPEYMGDNTIDMDNDTFKIMLLDDGHTPNSAHTQKSDVVADELANGNGYTTGGGTLDNVTWAESGGTTKFDADDEAWTSATFTARYAVVYSDTSTDDKLVCLLDFGQNIGVSSGTFTINFSVSGILSIT